MLYLLSKIKKKLWRYLHVAQKDRGLKIKVFDDQLSSIAWDCQDYQNHIFQQVL